MQEGYSLGTNYPIRYDMLKWLKNLIENKNSSTDEAILDIYGQLLERYPTAILDVSMLPRSKKEMKVIYRKMYAKTFTPAQRNILKVGFMLLSKFQDGVGPIPIDCALSSESLEGDIKADMEKLDRWLLWEKLSQAEQDVLLTEWKHFKSNEPV